jgi:hypothetical protein
MDDPNQTPQQSEAINTGTTVRTTGITIAKPMAYLNATIGSLLIVKTLCNAIDNDRLTNLVPRVN